LDRCDLLEIVPKNTLCIVQIPNTKNAELLKLFKPSKYAWGREMKITESNKLILRNLVLEENVEEEFQNLTIEDDSKVYLKAYDGMEIGEISKELRVPEWFAKKYIETNYCSKSLEW
jgi:pectate lyase